MKKTNSMNCIYGENGELIDIQNLQTKTQAEVVSLFKSMRKTKKMTQLELSKKTHIPQPNITRFESDKSNPTLELMVKIAAAYNMKVVIGLEEIDKEK